jgi:hypothetical protein
VAHVSPFWSSNVLYIPLKSVYVRKQEGSIKAEDWAKKKDPNVLRTIGSRPVVKTPEQIGTATLARLARQTERNSAAGSALRAEIRAAMGADTDLRRLTAKGIRSRLSRVPPPSIRTIQVHMRAIRTESAA